MDFSAFHVFDGLYIVSISLLRVMQTAVASTTTAEIVVATVIESNANRKGTFEF